MFNTSGGCIRRTPLECESEGGFVKVTEVKLPDLIDFHVTVDVILRECRVLCLNSCSCKAYAYSNHNGSSTGCLMWSGDLIDIQVLTSEAYTEVIYIHVHPSKLDQEIKEVNLELRLFDFAAITTATNNFSNTNRIGAGGFGSVYKGNLSAGLEVAVKRLSKNSAQGVQEFKHEAVLIAELQHKNLVRLLGYCVQGEERILL